MKSLIGLSRSLLHDLQRLHPECKGLDRDLRTIEARIKNEGVGFLSVSLPAFGKAFDQSLALGRMAHIAGFSRNGEIPKFLSGILVHVFDTKTGLLKESADPGYIVSIRQICYFFKKYLPADLRAARLEREAIRDFEQTEMSMGGIHSPLVDLLGRVCDFLLPKLDEFQDTRCKHGPGAVLEGYTPNEKWSEVYNRLLDFDGRLMQVGYDLSAYLLADGAIPPHSSQNDLPSLCAKLVTVPKSCSALRTITVEPCLNQFVQQGLNATLRDEIRKCFVLRNSLSLNTQVPNQELALEGSRTGKWVTVDLSSASDLLHNDLVKLVFRKKPRFLEALMNCRTPQVSINSKELSLKKFAGMGNATTFPVQSVVFASLAIASILQTDKSLSLAKLARAARCVRVFGDDIAIKAEHYPGLADWIHSFGLKINQGKTFSEGYFRESCGVDAYTGVDVTPVYLRHDPKVTSTEPNALLSLVSTSNQLWSKAYYKTSDYLRKLVEDLLGPLPLVCNSSSALGWTSRLNASQGQRWSKTLHRFEVRSYVIVPTRRKDALDGYPALLKFFHSPHLAEFDEDHLSTSVRKFNVKLRKRWVQA